MCDNNIHNVTKKDTIDLVTLFRKMIVINKVIAKVVPPYIIMFELLFSPNICTMTYPTTSMVASPLKSSVK
jgi:hypothetical protein